MKAGTSDTSEREMHFLRPELGFTLAVLPQSTAQHWREQ